MLNCHCSICRKAHGAAFATWAGAVADALEVEAAAGAITSYASSGQGSRDFCARCGASLFFRHQALADRVWIAVGTLDDDPGTRPECHIFMASKAPWFDVTDGLPGFAEYPG
jgi:hypothetical protein